MSHGTTALLFDGTGTANAEYATPAVDTLDYENLLIEVVSVGGLSSVSNLYFIDRGIGAAARVRSLALVAVANGSASSAGWGPGCDANASGDYAGGLPAPIPPSVSFTVNPLGAGVSARVRVFGRRHP
jgi:hypothetical protein